ncbi:MAG: hypothetical protein ACTSU5_20255 [Promethearchaeota archaeon]
MISVELRGDAPPFLERTRDDLEEHLARLCVGQDFNGDVDVHLAVRREVPGVYSPDGYAVRGGRAARGVSVEVASPTERGLMFGCYGLLHLLGVRWYFPGEGATTVRVNGALPTGDLGALLVESNPAFSKRGVVLRGTNDLFEEWLLFSARNRLNCVAVHSDGWLGGAAELRERYGVDITQEKHLWGRDACWRDAGRFERYYRALREKVARLPPASGPHSGWLFYWMADEAARRCRCDAHRGWRAGEVYLDLVNHLQERLERDAGSGDGVESHRLCYLAYWGSWTRLSRVAPNPRAVLELAPMHRCFSHGLRDPACRHNRGRVRGTLEHLVGLFGAENAQYLGYWLDSSLFGRQEFGAAGWKGAAGRGRIPNNPGVMRDDLRYLRQLGVPAVMTFAVGVDRRYLDAYTSPQLFLYPLLAWNPDADAGAAVAEFCESYLLDPSLSRPFVADELSDPKDARRGDYYGFIDAWERAGRAVARKLGRVGDQVARQRLEKLGRECRHVGTYRSKFWKARLVAKFRGALLSLAGRLVSRSTP